MDKKPAVKSKTLWLNAVVLGTAVTGVLLDHELISQYPGLAATLVVVQSTLNLILRFKTTQPVK